MKESDCRPGSLPADVARVHGLRDARTGEQIIRQANGQLTPLGTRLRGFMTRMKVNRTNQWDLWIDRDFILSGDMVSDNPWAVN